MAPNSRPASLGQTGTVPRQTASGYSPRLVHGATLTIAPAYSSPRDDAPLAVTAYPRGRQLPRGEPRPVARPLARPSARPSAQAGPCTPLPQGELGLKGRVRVIPGAALALLGVLAMPHPHPSLRDTLPLRGRGRPRPCLAQGLSCVAPHSGTVNSRGRLLPRGETRSEGRVQSPLPDGCSLPISSIGVQSPSTVGTQSPRSSSRRAADLGMIQTTAH